MLYSVKLFKYLSNFLHINPEYSRKLCFVLLVLYVPNFLKIS